MQFKAIVCTDGSPKTNIFQKDAASTMEALHVGRYFFTIVSLKNPMLYYDDLKSDSKYALFSYRDRFFLFNL